MSHLNVSAVYAQSVLGEARDGEMQLRLDKIYEPDDSPWALPAYRFDVMNENQKAGTISFRVGDGDRLVRFAGQIGFEIGEQYRGKRLAGRSVRLLLPLAASYDLNPLWLSCNPENLASMQVMKWLGATYIETVVLPLDYDRNNSSGERSKRRYRLDY